MNENLIAGLVIVSIPFIFMVVTLVRLAIEIKNAPKPSIYAGAKKNNKNRNILR
jgi:hypothetical protein